MDRSGDAADEVSVWFGGFSSCDGLQGGENVGFDVAHGDRQGRLGFRLDDAEAGGEFRQRRELRRFEVLWKTLGVDRCPAGIVVQVLRQDQIERGVFRERWAEA
ncbi:MAG: hypothetical protein HY270_10025 [Deltaproteobacteria bacterium]|nr:hypothetical protein [Deltaproteobacteria bacterium]